jgi:hypothetical protein
MNTQEMTKKVTELVQGGMSMEEALQKVLDENKPAAGSPRVQMTAEQRVEWIASLNNIAELRKAIKTAFAKKSKARENAETKARYEKEIKAGQARLNELIALINASDDPIAKAIELGEDTSGVIQKVLETYEKGLDEKLKKIQEIKGITNKSLKEEFNSVGATTPAVISVKLSGLGAAYLGAYTKRAEAGDQRVLTLNKRLNYLAKVTAEVTESQAAPAAENPVKEEEEPKNDSEPRNDTSSEVPGEAKNDRKNKGNNK